MTKDFRNQGGFTLVELLVVLGIMVVLLGLVLVNLGQTQTSSNLSSAVDTVVADLKSQQLLAMVGDIGSQTTQQSHGILIQSNQYILFANSTYSAGDTNNFTVTAPTNVSYSTTFPSSTVLFTKGDGAISGFTAGSNTITITRGASSKTITLTRFGAAAVN